MFSSSNCYADSLVSLAGSLPCQVLLQVRNSYRESCNEEKFIGTQWVTSQVPKQEKEQSLTLAASKHL